MTTAFVDRCSRLLLLIGLVGFSLCLIRFRLDTAPLLRGYLPACLFWTGVPLGSLSLLMIHHLTGGAWGVLIRPALQSAAATLPVNALLFLPLVLGIEDLYPWAAPEPALAEIASKKAVYLNITFFETRALVVFLAWLGLACALQVWSRTPQGGTDAASTQHLRRWSAAGLIIYGISVTLYGVDWIMSLQPRWTSTNFGFLMMAGPMVSALAFAIIAVCIGVSKREQGACRESTASRLHDLGNLLLAGVMLWSYLEFQQYLAIWYENLPDKVIWYLQRNRNGWQWITWSMALVYAALPMALLLLRRIKRSPRALPAVAALVLTGNLLNVYWLTAPAYFVRPAEFRWLDAASFLGIGGLWLAAFLWQFGRGQPTALGDIP